MDVIEKLRDFRKKHKLTQKQVAVDIGVSQYTLSHFVTRVYKSKKMEQRLMWYMQMERK